MAAPLPTSALINGARQVLREYGLATLLVLMFVGFGLYDRYVWSQQILDLQRQIIVSQAGLPSAVERNRVMADQLQLVASQTVIAAEAHRQQVVVLERIIDRLDRLERARVPGVPSGETR